MFANTLENTEGRVIYESFTLEVASPPDWAFVDLGCRPKVGTSTTDQQRALSCCCSLGQHLEQHLP